MVKSGEWLFLLSQAVSFFLGEVFFFVGICFVLWTLLPGKLTWNPKMELLEDKISSSKKKKSQRKHLLVTFRHGKSTFAGAWKKT